MKLKIKKYIVGLLTTVVLMFTSSCSDDFLDVKNPSKLDPSEFPVDIHSFELMMNSLYGQLRDGFYGEYFRSIPLIDHGNDNGYDGAEFNEFSLNNLNPNLVALRESWSDLFSHIAKCNDFIIKIREYEKLPEEVTRVAQLEAEAKFLRALNYFQLVNMFGESPILTEADKDKMGVPLWIDELPDNIASASRGRATQREIYNHIITDLEAIAPVFKGIGKMNNENPRIDEWTVKSLLAKSYMYTLQWSKAIPVLKDIIDNSGKELVSYDILRNMFSGRNEYNKESIWEVDFVYDSQTNDRRAGTGAIYQRFVSLTVLDGTGKEVINGYSNYYVHDANITRYGYNDGIDGKYITTVPKTEDYAKEQDPAAAYAEAVRRYEAFVPYKTYALNVRQDKSVDPRLYVAAYQPYVDSVNFLDQSWGWCPIVKGRMEGYPNRDMRAWNNRKYAADDDWYVGNCGINMYVFRLADIYLMYAESLIEMNDGRNAEALEYINKVHRRAYDQPIHTPSPYDYTTLTDRTKTVDANDHLANDVLKYERWAELINEGNWWFDVRRWNIGEQEVAYYKKSNSGELVWIGQRAYAWPIPQVELNANSLMVQNP